MKKILALVLVLMMMCGFACAEEEVINVVDELNILTGTEPLEIAGGDTTVAHLIGILEEDIDYPCNTVCAYVFDGGYFVEYFDEEKTSYSWFVMDDSLALDDYGVVTAVYLQALYAFEAVDNCYYYIGEGDWNVSLSRNPEMNADFDDEEKFIDSCINELALFSVLLGY